MWQCLLVAFGVSTALSVYSVNKFSNILNNPPVLSLILILALYIPFSIIFLLPIDLILLTALKPEDRSSFFYVESKTVILNMWRLNYWLGFFLTWFVLPIVQCYYSSDNFILSKRLKDSVVYNIKFYLAYFLAGAVGLVYVYFSIGLSFESIKALVIILSHSYTLILAIWFMGYGLINLPKSMFWDSMITRLDDQHLADHYFVRLLNAKESFYDSKTNFKEIVVLINNLHSIVELQNNAYHRAWIEYLYNAVENLFRYNRNIGNDIGEGSAGGNNSALSGSSLQRNLTNYNNRFNQELVVVNNQLSDEFLENVTRNFKDSYYNLLVDESHYYHLLKKVIKFQDIKASKSSHSLIFRAPNKTHLKYSVNNLINGILFKSSRSKYWYYYYVNPFCLRVFAAIFMLFSVIVIFSELFHNTKLSLLNMLIFNVFINKGLLTTISILISLGYMCFNSLISLSKTKVFLYYKLINKNSNPSSCLWYSSYAIRLTIPLSYNFLTLLNKQILSNTSPNTPGHFQKSQFALFLGNSLNLIGFGQKVNNILPYFILFPVFIQILQTINSAKKNTLLISLKKKFYLDELDFLLWDGSDDDDDDDDGFERQPNHVSENPWETQLSHGDLNRGSGDSSRNRLITNRVNSLIQHELSHPKSLLNTYDDNYSIFDSISLRHFVQLLRQKFTNTPALLLDSDESRHEGFSETDSVFALGYDEDAELQ